MFHGRTCFSQKRKKKKNQSTKLYLSKITSNIIDAFRINNYIQYWGKTLLRIITSTSGKPQQPKHMYVINIFTWHSGAIYLKHKEETLVFANCSVFHILHVDKQSGQHIKMQVLNSHLLEPAWAKIFSYQNNTLRKHAG